MKEIHEILCQILSLMMWLDLLVRAYGWMAVFTGAIASGGGIVSLLALWVLANAKANFAQ